MWLSADVARSDFILATAGFIFGGILVGIVVGLPIYPGGIVADLLLPLWVLLVSAFPARWLVRYRGQGLEGHGLTGDRSGIQQGLPLALPLLAAGYLGGLGPLGPVGAVAGNAGVFGRAGSTVGQLDLVRVLVGSAVLVAAAVSAVLLYGMLTTRARDAFRSADMPLVEALRTYGMGAAGAGLVMGLLMLVAGRRSVVEVGLDVGALAVLVLMTDRLLSQRDSTTRAAVLAPAAVVLASALFSSGGIFRGDLLGALYQGALGGGLAIVVASLVETKRAGWAVVPVVAASVWAPGCVTLPTLVRLCN